MHRSRPDVELDPTPQSLSRRVIQLQKNYIHMNHFRYFLIVFPESINCRMISERVSEISVFACCYALKSLNLNHIPQQIRDSNLLRTEKKKRCLFLSLSQV